MENLQAKDIMTRTVFTILGHEHVKSVAVHIVRENISGIPIVDINNILKGLVHERDILQWIADGQNLDLYIRDIMTPIEQLETFRPETSLEELVRVLARPTFRRVCITNDQGVLLGIVSRPDVIRALFIK